MITISLGSLSGRDSFTSHTLSSFFLLIMKRSLAFSALLFLLAIALSACTRFDSLQQTTTNNTVSGPINPRLIISSATLVSGVPAVTLNEGDVGRTSMDFVLGLENPNVSGSPLAARNDVIITYNTQDNNAIEQVDYDAASGTLIIPAGAVSGVIKVQIIGDTVVESDEAFRLTLSAVLDDADQTVLINSVSISGIILNDDNDPPVAVADTLSVLEDSGQTSVNVISNDTDTAGDILTLTAVSTAGTGTVTINSNLLSVNYIPASGFFGTEVVTYTVSDNNGGSDPTGTLTITVIRPEMSLHPSHAAEGDAGNSAMVFKVTTNSPLANAVSANFTASDGTATQVNNDYTATVANNIVTVPAGETTASFQVLINGDINLEAAEIFNVTLSNPSQGIILVTTATSVEGVITNGLNDTGFAGNTCATDTNISLPCPQSTYPGQDADFGRDAKLTAETQNKIGGGTAAFDFTKMDATGKALTNQAVSYAVTPWDCVRDNVTGLWWEVKTPDATTPTIRDKGQTYSWFNSTTKTNGGDAGTSAGGICANAQRCDTEKYVVDINAAGICGFNDWRLPTRGQLNSLLDYSIASPGPTLDTGFFPNTAGSGLYWSASPSAITIQNPSPSVIAIQNAWYVNFSNSKVNIFGKNQQLGVRLVRGIGE